MNEDTHWTPVTFGNCHTLPGPFYHDTAAVLPAWPLAGAGLRIQLPKRAHLQPYLLQFHGRRPGGADGRGAGWNRGSWARLPGTANGPVRGRPQRHEQAFPGEPHEV